MFTPFGLFSILSSMMEHKTTCLYDLGWKGDYLRLYLLQWNFSQWLLDIRPCLRWWPSKRENCRGMFPLYVFMAHHCIYLSFFSFCLLSYTCICWGLEFVPKNSLSLHPVLIAERFFKAQRPISVSHLIWFDCFLNTSWSKMHCLIGKN